MNYRQPHQLRVVTLSSRQSQGTVLYPPEFARLASSPASGDVTEPTQSRSRESRGTLIVLGVGMFLLALSYFTDGPLSVASGAGAAVWTVAGAWVTR